MQISAKEIGTAIGQNEVTLLVGSGTSCACGLPSWQQLTNEMKRYLRGCCSQAERAELNKFFEENDPPAIAGLFKKRRGSVEYFRWLRQRFRNKSVTLAPILRRLASLPVRVIFTTNYDKLLERSFRGASGEDPVVIIDPQQLSTVNGTETRIIKMHGDIDYPNSIILTDEDYAQYAAKFLAMRTFVQGHVAFTTMLLVGFGLRDPNFSQILAGARSLVADPGPRVVALMANQNRFDVEKWQAQGLTINNFDDYEEVPRFLTNVRRYC